jgi:peptidoglycan/xylan/chitin deacetylase (PgdA/CDA1 family)
MNLTPVTVPKFVKLWFPNLIWDIDTEEKALYLTFDDGPTPDITDWVLNCLKEYNAKATFFCIGKNVEKHPEIFQAIINSGHAIGNHTYSHVNGFKTSVPAYLDNATKAQNIINTQIQGSGFRIQKLFRPPYGRIKPKQAKALIGAGYKTVMWSVLSLDWENKVAAAQCYKNVIKNAVSGSVVVFHDSEKAAKNIKYALPKVLAYFSEKGYSFKRIPESGL